MSVLNFRDVCVNKYLNINITAYIIFKILINMCKIVRSIATIYSDSKMLEMLKTLYRRVKIIKYVLRISIKNIEVR